MTITLTQFLMENDVTTIEEKVVVSRRIKDEDGNLLEFKIKPLTYEQYSDYQKQCTIIKGKDVDFDYRKFNNLLVLNHTVEPNFKDAEFVKQVGAVYPEQAMGKVLLAGEISVLAEQIRKVSGFEDSLDDLAAQVKNS